MLSITLITTKEIQLPMINPPHPAEIVRREYLKPLGLTVDRAAKGLGVSCQTLSELVNERAGISAEMAIRLSRRFGSTPETWLGLQTAYELSKARSKQIKVERFVTPGIGQGEFQAGRMDWTRPIAAPRTPPVAGSGMASSRKLGLCSTA